MAEGKSIVNVRMAWEEENERTRASVPGMFFSEGDRRSKTLQSCHLVHSGGGYFRLYLLIYKAFRVLFLRYVQMRVHSALIWRPRIGPRRSRDEAGNPQGTWRDA